MKLPEALPFYDTDRKKLVKYYESICFENLTDGKNVIMYLKYDGEAE